MIRSKIYSPVYLPLLAAALLALSCEQQELETFDLDQNNPTTVVPDEQAGAIRKDGELVVVPLSVSLVQPASKAFQVELQLNPDTVNQLIGNGQLDDVVAVPANQVSIPTAATFAFGAKTSAFDIAVNVGFLERNYGKRVAFAYRLVNPGKGNTIAAESSSAVVVLNTADILQPDEIRYLSITNGGGGHPRSAQPPELPIAIRGNEHSAGYLPGRCSRQALHRARCGKSRYHRDTHRCRGVAREHGAVDDRSGNHGYGAPHRFQH